MTTKSALRVLCLLAVAALLSGCVRFRYSWINRNEPIEQSRIDELKRELAASEVQLQSCLDELGAPVLVWETTDGFAIAYGWRNQGSWTFHIGYTWQFVLRAHFDYTSATANLEGLVLWFDDDLRLIELRRGRLSDLVQSRRSTGSMVEDGVSPEPTRRDPPPKRPDRAP